MVVISTMFQTVQGFLQAQWEPLCMKDSGSSSGDLEAFVCLLRNTECALWEKETPALMQDVCSVND